MRGDSALFAFRCDSLYQELRFAANVIAGHCAATTNHGAIRSGIIIKTHPPRFARMYSKAERHARDESLRRIRKVGRKEWKKESNYHRRSLAETTVFRFRQSSAIGCKIAGLSINSKN
jgi:hypothetical protein